MMRRARRLSHRADAGTRVYRELGTKRSTRDQRVLRVALERVVWAEHRGDTALGVLRRLLPSAAAWRGPSPIRAERAEREAEAGGTPAQDEEIDPAQNIEGGARYLRLLQDQFGGDLDRVLAAYSAGPSVGEV